MKAVEQDQKEIDISAVAKQALQERQSGEDLDEVLLRACKHLYGDGGLTAFEAARSGLAAVAENSKVDVETALRRVAEGSIALRVRTVVKKSVTTQGFPQQSLDSLPPDVRDEVEKALAAGKTGKVVVTRRVVAHPGQSMGDAQQNIQRSRCELCGYESEIDFSTCPQCGKTKKRSLWSRLFRS